MMNLLNYNIEKNLGIWSLEDWTIDVAVMQIYRCYGIYCIKNKINNKYMIGEGKIGGASGRPRELLRRSSNKRWLNDVNNYGYNNFRLIWIIRDEDEVSRKLIENDIQKYYIKKYDKDNCYNTPRREYPTQEMLKSNIKVLNKINQYKIYNGNYNTPCWNTEKSKNKAGYGIFSCFNKRYPHHVIMYILHYGDICGISSVIHHKCNNKSCVNPEHLELTTHKKNIRLAIQPSKRIIGNPEYTSIYHGVHFSKRDKRFESGVRIDDKYLSLGYYTDDKIAAKNRDFYIVKNNLWENIVTPLNFHDIDYHNFNPYPCDSGKINHYLRELC